MVKKQHYIPQFYMKFWGVGRDNKTLWQYIKEKDAYFICHTDDKNCCNVNLLYEIKYNDDPLLVDWFEPNYIEKIFGHKEGEWHKTLTTLFDEWESCPHLTIRAHTQELLSDFIANLTVRNPCMVSQNRQRTQQIVDEIFSEPIDPILEGIMSLDPNFKESTLLEYVCKQILVPDMSPYVYKPSGPILGAEHRDILKSLLRRKMYLLKSENSSFVFSDLPALLVNFPDFSYFVCPLSPKYTALFVEKKYVCMLSKHYGFVSNHINIVDDMVGYSFLSPYLNSKRVTKIYAGSKLQLEFAIDCFRKFL